MYIYIYIYITFQVAPLAAVSGSDDGTVRLWDLLTGSCVHKLKGHSGAVQCLTATSDYVISCSVDDRLCIWERCKGLILHCVNLVMCSHSFSK